jgi:hypothetical protein
VRTSAGVGSGVPPAGWDITGGWVGGLSGFRLFAFYYLEISDWKWLSRCCCLSAAGPMPAADLRHTMHQRQFGVTTRMSSKKFR